MADEPEPDREVLSSLPRSRPARRSARRGPAEGAGVGAGDGETGAPRQPPPPSGWATPGEARATIGPVEAVATGVRAVGELVEIGVAVASQGVRSVLDRLTPR